MSMTDEEIQNISQDLADKYFNLSCPECGIVFYDWDRCPTLRCSNSDCEIYFCGICLDYSSYDEKECETHVVDHTFDVFGTMYVDNEYVSIYQTKLLFDELKLELTKVSDQLDRKKIINILIGYAGHPKMKEYLSSL